MTRQTYNVLMVDDDEDDIFAIRRGFSDARVDVSLSAVTGAAPLFDHLKSIAPAVPDLILLDINMPRMNGFEVLSELKSTRHWAEIPVFVLSTSEHDTDRIKAHQLGADDFETKFSSMKTLDKWVQKVEKFLRAQP